MIIQREYSSGIIKWRTIQKYSTLNNDYNNF